MKRSRVMRSLWLSMLLAASAAAVPALAQVQFNITVGPPAPQYEVVPVLAPGYVWAPGYWAWNGERHIWIHGRGIFQRPGYRWQPDVWEQRNNTYYRNPGRWERDSEYRAPQMHNGKMPKHWDNRNHERGKRGRDHKEEGE